MTKLLADKAQRRDENAGLGPGAHPRALSREPAHGWMDGGLGLPWMGLGQSAPSCWLPVILGAVAQGKPPLDCSGSPRSKGSRGLGLYSRLGREEASRILHGREQVSSCSCRAAS